MGVEKQGSRSGGAHVGGFLQLFDWSGKSQKKLPISAKLDENEGSRQGNISETSLQRTLIHLIDEDECAKSSMKGNSDYSCSSSVTDDGRNGSKAPGVVARLMGLDSLPSSSNSDSYSTTFFDTQSLGDVHSDRGTRGFHNEAKIADYSYRPVKVEGFSKNFMESRRQNMQNIPIERFQSEMLPPKSAKSIPISHHKLLSPIKSSGFISEKSVAHIMEAAARIIDQGPQTSRKGEMPSAGLRSSSVPLRVRDLKDKVETAQRPSQRPVESNAGRNLRGQSLNKRWNGSENAAQFRACSDSEESKSVGSRNTGKSTSLAVQAKADVQRKEGVSFASRTIVRHKEHQDLKPNQLHKIQPNHQKNVQNNVQKKLPTNSSTGALRQNNQKQNYLVNTDTLPSNQLVPNVQSRKAVPCGAYVTHNKISKLGTKTGFEALDNGNEAPSSGRKSNPQKKQTLERNCQFQKCGTVGTILVSKNNVKSNQPNAEIDEHSKRVEDNRRKGLDIVSFTFTSPMVKSKPQHMSDSQVSEDDESFCAPANSRNAQPSSLGMNVIGEDSLSVLLEQKLRELTNGVESSYKKSVKSGSFETSVSILQDLVSDPNAVNAATREFDMKSQLCIPKDEFTHLHNSKYSTNYGQILKMNDRLQVVEEMEGCSSSNVEIIKELCNRHPSPISILEPSFSSESYISADSEDNSNRNIGNKQCSSSQAQLVDAETELSDSASSTCTEVACGKHVTRLGMVDDNVSDKKLKYVREILSKPELMFKDLSFGETGEVINYRLFERLETTWSRSDFSTEKDSRLRRKVLFDCVGECMDLRCRRYVVGGYRTWAKGVEMFRNNGCVAEEVYKDISEWGDMGDWMVDELVDKDMSTQYGRWLDFETEEFDFGVEIQKSILSSLLDEVVADF